MFGLFGHAPLSAVEFVTSTTFPDPAAIAIVPLAVPQAVVHDVAEGVSELLGRPDRHRVEPVGEDLPLATEPPVDPPRDPDLPALHPLREVAVRVGFRHDVHVVALDRELADPERALPAAVDERGPEHLAELERVGRAELGRLVFVGADQMAAYQQRGAVGVGVLTVFLAASSGG